MTDKTKIAVEENPDNGEWDLGWKCDDDHEFTPGYFTPMFCGYATKAEAEADIPGFDERVKKHFDEGMREIAETKAAQNERFPNVGYVRARIAKIKDPSKALDASEKLAALLDMDLAEYIRWPLPSWTAIKSGRVYGR